MVEFGSMVWLDGKLVDWDEGGHVSILTHTLHYGLGAFEGIRAYHRTGGDTVVFRLHEHIQRLFDSCQLVMMTPTVSQASVSQGCVEVLKANSMAEAYIRPICTLGQGAMGLLPGDNPVETRIVAWKWGTYLGAEGLTKGIRCKISSYARHHVNVSFSRAKLVGQYVNSVVAKQEVTLAGYDEAIMLDVHGYVAEGSGENIFIVKNGLLKTPPTSSSILPGITRDTILTLAKEEGIPVVEERFARDELLLADEVFLTGTAAEVTPVREIDNRAIGSACVGPITRTLQERYFAVVRGTDNTHPEWFTRV